jgi:hypothetical protein
MALLGLIVWQQQVMLWSTRHCVVCCPIETNGRAHHLIMLEASSAQSTSQFPTVKKSVCEQ